MQHAAIGTAKCVHPNTAFQIKNESFSVLAWRRLILIWSRCPAVCL